MSKTRPAPENQTAIKDRWSGDVIYISETATDVSVALMEAVKANTDLSSADLSSANLSSADLYRANLSRANLSRANLSSANLYSANLSRANLSRANLSSADLSSANLSSAKIDGHICNGQFVQILSCAEWGPLLAYITDKAELRVICGCRHMSIEDIEAHWKDRADRRMSRVALAMVRAWHKEIAA